MRLGLTFGLVCCLLPIAASAGCASAAIAENMIPEELVVAKQQPYSVTVITGGGQETDPMWSSQISDDAMRTAIVAAITNHRVFQEVRDADGQYVLNVSILDLDQPVLGFNMTVGLLADWMLIDGATQTVIWRHETESSHTATVGDAFVGTTRLRLANEGAAKKNIKAALEMVSGLDLPGQ